MSNVVNESSVSAPHAHSHGEPGRPSSLVALTLGSIGVVYGDIGTSPLYAFREAVTAAGDGGPITLDIVLGVLSLILWSLIIVVTAKYVLLLLRADNNGEGGTLSLTALAARALGRRTTLVFLLGVVGAAIASAILSIFGIALGGWLGYLIAGFIGACLLIWIVRMVRGTRPA